MNTEQKIEQILASPSVHTLTKDTLRAALTKDPLDAYRDVTLAAELLRERLAEMMGVRAPR